MVKRPGNETPSILASFPCTYSLEHEIISYLKDLLLKMVHKIFFSVAG